jgi:hypothetical protein
MWRPRLALDIAAALGALPTGAPAR